MAHPYIIGLKLAKRACLVAGGGDVAERKIKTLLATGARITVVAREANEEIERLAQDGAVVLHRRGVIADDAAGTCLVIAATDDRDKNREIAGWARRAGALVNVADSPEESDFFVPATVQRGDFSLAISTSGRIPALARRLRVELEAQFGPEYGMYVELLEEVRRALFASTAVAGEDRQRILAEVSALDLIPLLRNNKIAEARAILQAFLKKHGIEEPS
jgi:precorrin-2 dehydrogenase / sirohydrochlorin ferrochelatase